MYKDLKIKSERLNELFANPLFMTSPGATTALFFFTEGLKMFKNAWNLSEKK